MTKEIDQIFKEIILNSTYNQQTKEYILNKEFYDSLNLSQSTRKRINDICEKKGITLIYPNKLLTVIKGEELFQEYNNIKAQLELDLVSQEREKLEQRRIYLRNKIVLANTNLIRNIIERRLNGKSNINEIYNISEELEDLYQLGYEVLLDYIDKHYLIKEEFERDIKGFLMLRIRNIYLNQIGINSRIIDKLNKIKELISKDSNISLEDLAKQAGLEVDEINTLLNLNNILTAKSLDEIIAISNEISETDIFIKDNISPLYDDTFEDKIYEKIKEDQILRLIETLTLSSHQQTIILTYGLAGENEHTQEEIATILNLNKKSIYGTKEKALKNLTHPARLKYLVKILDYDIEKYLEYSPVEELLNPQNKDIKRLERFLLQQLKKEDLLQIIESMNPKLQKAILSYLGYNQTHNQTKNKNNLSTREKSLNLLRQKITQKYVTNNPNIKDYYDYLMHNYLTKKRTK